MSLFPNRSQKWCLSESYSRKPKKKKKSQKGHPRWLGWQQSSDNWHCWWDTCWHISNGSLLPCLWPRHEYCIWNTLDNLDKYILQLCRTNTFEKSSRLPCLRPCYSASCGEADAMIEGPQCCKVAHWFTVQCTGQDARTLQTDKHLHAVHHCTIHICSRHQKATNLVNWLELMLRTWILTI